MWSHLNGLNDAISVHLRGDKKKKKKRNTHTYTHIEREREKEPILITSSVFLQDSKVGRH